MEYLIGVVGFIVVGLVLIGMYTRRNKDHGQTMDEIAKTQYYDLLDDINHMYKDRPEKNREQIKNFFDRIDQFEKVYYYTPNTASRVERMKTDLQLKEMELLGGDPVQLFGRILNKN